MDADNQLLSESSSTPPDFAGIIADEISLIIENNASSFIPPRLLEGKNDEQAIGQSGSDDKEDLFSVYVRKHLGVVKSKMKHFLKVVFCFFKFLLRTL
jgi:hypothetical protein